MITDRKKFEAFVSKHSDGTLWQSWVWGEFQESLGRKVYRFSVERDGRIVATAQVVQHKLRFGLSYYYLPRGPIVSEAGSNDILHELIKKIQSHAKKNGTVFIKIDGISASSLATEFATRFSTSPQPDFTSVIDLTKSENEILALMKQKGRYNIRLSEKKGVKLKTQNTKLKKWNDLDNQLIADFFKLLEQTTRRDEFRGHGKDYYSLMLKKLGEHAELIMAYFDNKPIAGGIFTFYGKQAVYYYGASSDSYRNFMAPYLVQWKAISIAKERGCSEYDFLGVAPEGVNNHPWAGVTEFKSKFGGAGVARSAPFDLVLRPMWYLVYKTVIWLKR
jgi:lipid II:glycine glycyltransferase (peptidoglycan interpeptide bridge formation enzyme)